MPLLFCVRDKEGGGNQEGTEEEVEDAVKAPCRQTSVHTYPPSQSRGEIKAYPEDQKISGGDGKRRVQRKNHSSRKAKKKVSTDGNRKSPSARAQR